jgi:hypothetical protein
MMRKMVIKNPLSRILLSRVQILASPERMDDMGGIIAGEVRGSLSSFLTKA